MLNDPSLYSYWDIYYNNNGSENIMWFSEHDIEKIQNKKKLPFKTAQFLWQKTEHSVPTIERAEPQKGMRILELGCGIGGFTLAYLLRYCRVPFQMVAVDFSAVSVEITRARIEQFKFTERCKAQEADILGLPFENDSFDFVICPSVLEHIPEQDQALLEMARVCKKNGSVVISTDNKNAFISRISVWCFTNAFANLLKHFHLLNRPKGYFIPNDAHAFQKKLKKIGLDPTHLSYTEFGFPGFRQLVFLISKLPILESIFLPLIRWIEHKSFYSKWGYCHSVFLSLSKKI